MKVKTLTDRYIETLKPMARPYTVFEDKFKGCFGVQVRPTGRKSFLTVYHAKGRQNWVVLRSPDGRSAFPDLKVAEARDLAGDILSDVRRDQADPAEARRVRREARTFAEVVDAWEAHRKALGRRTAEGLGDFVRTYAEDLLHRKVCDIDSETVRGVLEAVAAGRGLKRGKPAPSTSNKLRTVLHGVFQFALLHKDLKQNPVAPLSRIWHCKVVGRQHVPSVAEFKVLWKVLDTDASAVTGAMLKLATYTGARIGEVRSLKWNDVDLGNAMWEVRTDASKNGKSRRIPLSEQAVAVLEGVRALDLRPGEYVFPKAFGPNPDSFRGKLGDQIQALKKDRPELREFVGPHDLRRFFATNLEELGVRRAVVEQLLGHVDSSVTGRYARPEYALQKRAAVQTFADWVDTLMTQQSETPNVVPLRPAAEVSA